MSRRPSARACGIACALMLAVGAPADGGAQMLGVPVLQNAFANPGFTVAGNFGTQDGARGYGGAVAWAPGRGRFQLSAGAGVFDVEVTPDDRDRTFTWGARGAFSFLELMNASVGVGAFVGLGGFSRDRVTELRVPVGASVGWRRALGETRAISLYLAPFYAYSERRFDDAGVDCDVEECPGTNRAGAIRVSAGVDLALFRSLGLTLGYEDGQRADDGDPGPASGVFGIGLSYAFGGGRR